VAVLTPPGRGALAVVGVTGVGAALLVDAVFAARGGRAVAGRADGAVAFGSWGGVGGEEVVVVRHAADRVEVHCHGGLAAAAAIGASLVGRGAHEIDYRAWLSRSDHDAGTTAVEARTALPFAGGPKAARMLCRQLAGALDAEIARIERLVMAGETDVARIAVDRLVRASRVGLRLNRPWRVVVTGAVNTGKSSLVNALAGHARSIVSPVPGTTRDLVETRIALDGWEVDLIDTAGIREQPAGAVEAAGIARATAATAAADLVLRVVPADAAPACPAAGPGELVVLSKGDLAPVARPDGADAIRTSAVSGAGIDKLACRIVAALVPEETVEPDLLTGAIPFTPRQIEVVRGLIPPATGRLACDLRDAGRPDR
jgi:tRNA modification GTPase